MDKQIIGIDIGGTNIKLGLLNVKGDILNRWEIPTVRGKEIKHIWESVLSKVSKNDIENNILGIGVGAPGFVDGDSGIVFEAVNLGWKNFELGKLLSTKFSLPVVVENDANLAALGEYWKGAGDRVENLIFITLGTGVGSGIIANGSILNGENGTAGEIGHIIVDPNGYPCNCGRVGCLDTISSATGIVRQAKEKVKENPSCSLAHYLNTRGSIDAKDIFTQARNGDPDCIDILEYTAEMLGKALANAAAIINPSKIIIGGGVSQAGEQLLNLTKKYFIQYSLGRIGEVTNIEIAKLGNNAGIIGAAYLVAGQRDRSLVPQDSCHK
ncbi:ROK family glucokinase [Fredinandcohnia onubensis]|uniref:ROK family glucokinase n=1 Tax=Fredinandcohnia onubensis TaxID=1571209 RepID=UPI000C0BBEAC|nr:ROK family glucokinase [Fredinandcohnia onubensis]